MNTIQLYNQPLGWMVPYAELMPFPIIYSLPEQKRTSISETPFEYKLEFDIPELKKKDLTIKLDNNQLIIEGRSKKSSFSIFKRKRYYQEASYYKVVSVSDDMDVDNIHASLKRGILTIEIPKKKEHYNYRQIPVSGNDKPEIIEVPEKDNSGLILLAKRKLIALLRKAA